MNGIRQAFLPLMGSDDRRGQALVEFALVAPIFLLLVIGVVEFGRAWNIHQVVQDAAREGVRAGVVLDPKAVNIVDSVTTVVEAKLAVAGLDTGLAEIDVEGEGLDPNTGTGRPLQVSVSYQHHLFFLKPFMGWGDDDAALVLNGASVMRKE